MKFAQRALLFHKAEFEFGEKALDYLIEDEKTRYGFSIPYDEISGEKTLRTYREKTLVYFGLLFCGAELLSRIMFRPEPMWLSWALIAIGLVSFVTARFSRFTATLLNTRLGNVIIFDRRHKAEILDLILDRRTKELRRKYASIDLLGDPAKEIAKFRWLADRGVISEAELSASLQALSVPVGSRH